MTYITDIPRQTVTIDGTAYTPDEATAHGAPSRLQTLFRRKYGEGSFHASLADFLTEWFDGSDTLTVHTSGSTGTPKELRAEKRRMMNSAVMTLSFLRLKPGDTALLCMPLQYIAGKMVAVRALVGGLNLIPKTPGGHPLKGMAEAPDFAAMIPMQVFNSLAVAEEKKLLQAVGHLIVGGGAIDASMEKELRGFPCAVWSTYGMTETLSHIALRRISGDGASLWYTPFEGVGLRLSEAGTLAVRAPQVCEGELVTNDIAELNADGRFRIIGRRDNTVNTGGVKVQIEEVEAALAPHISRPFAITSVPDPKFGERIVMLVQGSIAEEEARRAFSALPPYWKPKQTFCVEKLPQTGTGKPDRAAARETARRLAAGEQQ